MTKDLLLFIIDLSNERRNYMKGYRIVSYYKPLKMNHQPHGKPKRVRHVQPLKKEKIEIKVSQIIFAAFEIIVAILLNYLLTNR